MWFDSLKNIDIVVGWFVGRSVERLYFIDIHNNFRAWNLLIFNLCLCSLLLDFHLLKRRSFTGATATEIDDSIVLIHSLSVSFSAALCLFPYLWIHSIQICSICTAYKTTSLNAKCWTNGWRILNFTYVMRCVVNVQYTQPSYRLQYAKVVHKHHGRCKNSKENVWIAQSWMVHIRQWVSKSYTLIWIFFRLVFGKMRHNLKNLFFRKC